ncbi:hypothetical protein RHGRI_013934 [Rhododendron griersonianum]|uniref:Secreted peptide n=1 Tax=Rhododendron griersonianum TaxID=479676 RepID=A0AAV6K7F1_9ERIC|nr:hypothetical protein RHGRI_013934 [Rhododendron griersonianum]
MVRLLASSILIAGSLSTTPTASSTAGLRGSIALPVPVIAAAVWLLPVTAVVVPSVVLQPAVFAVEGSQSIRVSAVPRVASDEP